ncbi:MAG: MMPL family transporter, partial [Corynebacteriales bacterium]|nr:MMPL family transporter [Mycobacteriales bacterium]
MNGLSTFVLRHKVLVTLFWVAAMVAGMMAAGKLGDKFSNEFKIPGQEGYNANRAIIEKYHNGGEANPIIPVVSVSDGKITDDKELVAAFGGVLDELNQQGLRGISYPHTQDPAFITDDGKSMFAVVAMPPIYDAAERDKVSDTAVASIQSRLPANATLTVTGLNELATADEQAEESSSGALMETLIGAGGALIILLFVFGSFMALVPLLVAAVSILTTFLAIYGVAHVLDMSEIVQYVVSLIGLGVAIDYSLLLVTRWREERGNGLDKIAATHKAMATAGRSVIFSGAAVAAGLLVLVLLPVPFLKTLGAGSVLSPLFSVLVTLT